MRYVRYILNKDLFQKPRLGVEVEEGVFDLNSAYKSWLIKYESASSSAAEHLANSLFPGNIVEFLQFGNISINAVYKLMNGDFDKENYIFSETDITLLSPIVNPPHLRDFISFEDHISNARKRRSSQIPEKWYEIPAYYKGGTSTIIGPDDDVVWPNYSEFVDYELEIACIIGKPGKNIKKEKAEDYIFGYTILNDFSARDIQFAEMSIGLGPAKGKDFATALGPCIVTKEALTDPYNLTMKAYVNGEQWSEGSSSTIYRTFAEMIEYASQSEMLLPGDILGSGTVGLGCGLELGKKLKPNDIVELEIEGIGKLKNTIIKQ